MTDPAQILKAQIGELMWANAILNAKVEELNKQIEELKQVDKKDA